MITGEGMLGTGVLIHNSCHLIAVLQDLMIFGIVSGYLQSADGCD
jgi:hypothetical protein